MYLMIASWVFCHNNCSTGLGEVHVYWVLDPVGLGSGQNGQRNNWFEEMADCQKARRNGIIMLLGLY